MKKVFVVALGLAIAGLAATRAQATPIGQFTSSDGLVFTLSDDGAAPVELNGSVPPDTEQFSLTLDSSGYTGSSTDVFSSLALGLVNGPSYDAEQLASAPSLSGGLSWSDQAGGLNNGGCDSSGGVFFCTDVTNGSAFVPTGGVALNGASYTWTWYVDPGTNGFNLPGEIKAQWFTSSGDKINQISNPFDAPGGPPPPPPTVPEPTTLLLLSSGLAGVIGSKLRRRSN
jgi:hypothetical protein